MPKRLIAANNLFEETLLNFAQQVRPEAKNAPPTSFSKRVFSLMAFSCGGQASRLAA